MIKLNTNIFKEEDNNVIVNLITKANTSGITQTYNALKSLKKENADTTKNISNGLKNMFNAAGITASVAGITKSIKKAVTAAADYEESLNLFHMALGDYYKDGLKWSRKIADSLYLDDSQILQYTGSFFNLTKGLGASSDAAYLMSKNLTQLTYDMSSYLNIDVSAANTKLMSAMSGQTKAVTSVGIAVQQASLQELAYSMGIKKSIRDMTQAEKTYLRYIQIIRSTKNMQGDLARTIITPTNAFRMLSTQVVLLGRAIGQVLTPLIYKLMPMLIALTRVITDAAKQLASFFGYEIQDIDYSGVEGLTDSVKNLGKEVDKTAAKAHRMLAPFDQLNVVEGGKSGKGGSGDSILGQLEKELKGYDMLEDLNKKMQGSIEDWEKKIKGLVPIALGVAGTIGAIKIAKFVGGISKGIDDIVSGTALAGTAFEGLGSTIGLVMLQVTGVATGGIIAIKGVYDTYKGVEENVRDSSKGTVQIIKGGLETVVGSALAGFAVFGPAGAVGGAILGLGGFFATTSIAANKAIHDIALEQLNDRLGTVNVSTEQWLNTLLGSNSTLMNVVRKIDEFNKSIEQNTQTFDSNIGQVQTDVALYSTGVGEYATITSGLLDNITKDMTALVTSSSNGIKNYTDKNLLILKDQYATANDEEKKLLDWEMERLSKHSTDTEAEINKNKNAIIEIYKKASKERRTLTEEEYDKVKQHLNNINIAYTTFTGDAETVLSQFFDNSGKLRDGYNYDTIKNFVEAKNKYLDEVKKASDKEYEESKKYWDKLLSTHMTKQETYDRAMIVANNKRNNDMRTAQETVSKYTQNMFNELSETYQELEGKTDSVSIAMRQEIENTFKDLDIPMTSIQKPIENAMDSAINNMSKYDTEWAKTGENGANAFTQSFAKTISNSKLQLTVSTTAMSNGKNVTISPKVTAIKAKAEGGYLDKGDLFVANEAGPEFITSVGNKSAVINQGQMVAALSNSIIHAMGNISNKEPQQIIVKIGNDKVYQGQGTYQDRQNDRYGTTVVQI